MKQRTRIQKRTKRALARSRSLLPSQPSGPSGLQQIHEVWGTQVVIAAAAGTISQSFAISPAGLLLAARLAGYQTLADEVRIDLANVVLTPVLSRTAPGRVTMYIERDPTAAVVATVDLASDQRERFVGSVRDPLSLTWRPQEPDDLQFNLLNPGTTSLGKFCVVGDSIKRSDGVTATVGGELVFTAQIRVAMTLRGRP